MGVGGQMAVNALMTGGALMGGGDSGGGVTTVPTWNKQQKQIFKTLTPQVLRGISQGVNPFAPGIDEAALAQWTPPIDWGQLASIADYADWEKLGLTDLSAGGLATLLKGIDPAYAMREYTDVIGPKVYEAVAPQVMESLAGGMSSDLLHGTPAVNAFAQALAPYGPQWVNQRMGLGQQAVQQAYGRESELYQRSQAAYALKQAQWEQTYQRTREEFLRTQPENSVWFDRAMQLLGVTTQAAYATQPTTSPLMQILSGLAPGIGEGFGNWMFTPQTTGSGGGGGGSSFGWGDATSIAAAIAAIFSDERMKNIEGNFTEALSVLEKIPIHTYTYKQGTVRHVGMTAQELGNVRPGAVLETSDGAFLVDVADLVSVLIAAVKELKVQVNSLAERG